MIGAPVPGSAVAGKNFARNCGHIRHTDPCVGWSKRRARQEIRYPFPYFGSTRRHEMPPGKARPVGVTNMVEGVKAGRVGGAPPPAREGVKTPVEPFQLDDGAAPPGQNARLSSVAGIGMESMLALQAVDEAVERDRAARKRSSAMLFALTNLQRALLAEEDPAQALRALNELTADGSLANDPGLAAIVREVELRSRVETARRDRGRS